MLNLLVYFVCFCFFQGEYIIDYFDTVLVLYFSFHFHTTPSVSLDHLVTDIPLSNCYSITLSHPTSSRHTIHHPIAA